MANVEHSALTGASLHEPKGVSAASVDTVYVSNGAGSGTWEKITADSIDTSTINNLNKVVLNVHLNDLSTAQSHYVVSPLAGDIIGFYSVIDQAIATTDTTLSLEIGGTAVTGGSLTIAFSGSAAGDINSSTPTAANTVTAGQSIEIVCGGETNTSGAHATVSLLMDVS